MDTLARVHFDQRAFRAVMDAVARPGKVMELPAYERDSDYPRVGYSLAALIDMFIDQGTRFSVVPESDKELVRSISMNTHSSQSPLDKASFIVVPTDADPTLMETAITQASAGTLISPEEGASILVGCKRIVSNSPSKDSFHWVSVEGSGVETSNVFGIDRVDWAWARNRREDEFPCGIEIILVDEVGHVVAIPRTSFVSLLAMENGV